MTYTFNEEDLESPMISYNLARVARFSDIPALQVLYTSDVEISNYNEWIVKALDLGLDGVTYMSKDELYFDCMENLRNALSKDDVLHKLRITSIRMHPQDADIVITDLPNRWTIKQLEDLVAHAQESCDDALFESNVLFMQVQSTRKGDSKFARIWLADPQCVYNTMNELANAARSLQLDIKIAESRVNDPYKVVLFRKSLHTFASKMSYKFLPKWKY